MLTRARLQDKERTFGYCSVEENAQVVQWGGSMFIRTAANERVTERGRMVQLNFQRVSTDIEVIRDLDEEF